MQRVHRKGSEVLSECYKVGYSATLARAQGHNFKGGDKVLVVEGSECTIKWHTEKKPSSHSITPPPPPVSRNQQCLTAEPGVGSCTHFSP